MQVSTTEYAALLRRYLAPESGRALLLAVLLLCGIGLQLLNPQIVRAFIDAIAAGQPPDRLVLTALLFLAVALLHQGLSVWAAYVGEDVGWSSTNRLRSDLARHCLDLDMAWHNDRTPGELIERIDGDVTALASFFSQLVIRVFGSLRDGRVERVPSGRGSLEELLDESAEMRSIWLGQLESRQFSEALVGDHK